MRRDWIAEQAPAIVERILEPSSRADKVTVAQTALIKARQETVAELANFAQARFPERADLCVEVAVMLRDFTMAGSVHDRLAGRA